MTTFETVDGFRMELVASEPLVASPVAAAIDEDGNLFVAEMRDYPFRPKPGHPPLGTVRLLRDTDGDGRYDRAHVFAEELLWAAGIAPWKGGVFVASPPDIWYLKDTDGDHKADVRTKVFTGFGVQNQQGMLNNLVYGLDHKIYGSTASNGGVIRPGDNPNARGVSVNGRDFRFDPATGVFESITGTIQFGNTFDDWGNRFLCSESRPLLHPVLPQYYLARNPYLPVPSAIDDLAPGPVPIYRISPIERWRQIRSSRRIAHGERSASAAGASHHVVDAGAGVTVYRGGAYPAKYYGRVFLGDAQNNLIHERALSPAGPSFTSARVDDKTEFIRSSDNWFRPVNLLNAPDGTLYALDMSRETLEAIHIPLDVVKHLDLRRGRDQGRIYRIAPAGFRSPHPPRLSKATGAELVAALESPHGWWRDTAHRLLHERQDPASIEPLRKTLRQSPVPQARVLALWSLQGMAKLSDDDLLQALGDSSPHVREHAVRLAEPRLASRAIVEKVLSLQDDPDARVRFQLAFSLGELHDPRAAAALANLARRDGSNAWARTAILSSSAQVAGTLLADLMRDEPYPKNVEGANLIESLAQIVGARNRAPEIGRLFDAVTDRARSDGGIRERIVLGMGRGMKQTGARLTIPRTHQSTRDRFLSELFERAQTEAQDRSVPEAKRFRAIALLGCAAFANAREPLTSLLDPKQAPPIQLAALRALADYPDEVVAPILLASYPQVSPSVRASALQYLLSRDAWTVHLLREAKAGRVPVDEIEPARRTALLKHRNAEIVQLASLVFSTQSVSPRHQVLTDYRSALALQGDPARGLPIFKRHCTACHKIGELGAAVGPDLTSSASRDPAALLTHILDPNQYVLPNFIQYLVTDTDGRTYSGLIATETATSVTLKRGDNVQDTLLRSQIDEIVSTRQSLMPEGFERLISQEQMADLIAYLISSHGTQTTEDPLDKGTSPGSLVEPDR
jgi:putative membrane-bound dehydrogenase-like protein